MATELSFLAPSRRVGRLGRVTVSLLAIAGAGMATAVVLFGSALIGALGTYDDAATNTWASAYDGLFVVLPWVLLTAELSFLAWVFTTIRQVHGLGRGEHLVSASAGVFFVLMMVPFGVMRELRRAVVPDDRSMRGHLLGVWSATWLGTVALSAYQARFAEPDLSMPDDARVLAMLGLAYALAWTATLGLTAWNVHLIAAGAARLEEQPTP